VVHAAADKLLHSTNTVCWLSVYRCTFASGMVSYFTAFVFLLKIVDFEGKLQKSSAAPLEFRSSVEHCMQVWQTSTKTGRAGNY